MELKFDKHGRVVQGELDDLGDPRALTTAMWKAMSEASDPGAESRIERCIIEFEARYSDGRDTRTLQAILYGIGMLGDVLPLYLLGRNSTVYGEVYSWLERTTIECFPRVITRVERRMEVLARFIERRTLGDFCKPLVELRVWGEDDARFIRKLTQIRNGIAHRNADLISRHVNSGNPLTLAGIAPLVDETDAADAIVRALSPLTKVQSSAYAPDTE